MTKLRRPSPTAIYETLLVSGLSPERFVREALQDFEDDFRATALLALADWQKLGIVRNELFQAVAALQRPSWGMWNGLIGSLKKARKEVLRSADDTARERVASAEFLATVLKQFELRLDSDVASSLTELAELCRTSIPKKLRLNSVLTMPISLRNRIAHDAPSADEWWENTAKALRPLVEFHAHLSPLSLLLDDEHDYPEPWFLVEDDTLWTFNGLERDSSVNYVSGDGTPKNSKEQAHPTMLSFQSLLGKTDGQDDDFRKLLSKLAPDEIKGVMLGGYLVGRPVGAGGFATVHVARELSTGRRVALKILHDGQGERTKERFQQEARFLSRLDHPHIVEVFGFGEDVWSAPRNISLSDEEWFQSFSKSAPVRTWIAMEWVDGETLDSVVRLSKKNQQGVSDGEAVDPATLPEVLRQGKPGAQSKQVRHQLVARWFAQSASALSAVHNAGLVHRDLKPSNLMFDGDGNAKLMDFGIARSQDRERTLKTTTGGALGTPAYMAPEQLKSQEGDDVGPTADVYGLCATFYELFTGTRLFDHDTATLEVVTTKKLSGDRPKRPRRLARGLPWELETILMGGLEHRVRDRYSSMEMLRLDIENYLRDEPISYRRPGLFRRMQLGYRRNRFLTNVVVLFLILGAIGIFQYVRNLDREKTIAEHNAEVALKEKAKARAQQDRAEREANRARSRTILSQAENLFEEDPILALLLAQDSVRDQVRNGDVLPESIAVLNHGLSLTGGQTLVKGPGWSSGKSFSSKVACDISPDGRWVVVGAYGLETRVLDLTAKNPETVFIKLGEGWCEKAQFTPDGRHLVVVGGQMVEDDPRQDGPTFEPAIHIWNTTTEDWASRPPKMSNRKCYDFGAMAMSGFKQWFAISSDSRWVAAPVATQETTKIGLIDLKGTEEPVSLISLEGESRPCAVAFSNDGRQLIIAGRDGSVELRELRGGKVVRGGRLKSPNQPGDFGQIPPTSAVIHVDDQNLVIGFCGVGYYRHDQLFDMGNLHIWKLNDLNQHRERSGFPNGVTAIQQVSDGKIATGSADGTIRIWPAGLDSSKGAIVLREHTQRVTALRAVRNGSELISASEDGSLRFWSVNANELRSIRFHG